MDDDSNVFDAADTDSFADSNDDDGKVEGGDENDLGKLYFSSGGNFSEGHSWKKCMLVETNSSSSFSPSSSFSTMNFGLVSFS